MKLFVATCLGLAGVFTANAALGIEGECIVNDGVALNGLYEEVQNPGLGAFRLDTSSLPLTEANVGEKVQGTATFELTGLLADLAEVEPGPMTIPVEVIVDRDESFDSRLLDIRSIEDFIHLIRTSASTVSDSTVLRYNFWGYVPNQQAYFSIRNLGNPKGSDVVIDFQKSSQPDERFEITIPAEDCRIYAD